MGGGVLVAVAVARADLRSAWLLAALATALSVMHTVPYSLLAGLQRWREAAMVGLVVGSVGTVAVIVVLWAGGGITGMFAVTAASSAVSLSWAGAIARRHEVALTPEIEPVGRLRGELLRYAGVGSLRVAFGLVVTYRSEVFFLERYSTPTQIAYYSVAFAIITALTQVPRGLLVVLFPAFGHLSGAGEVERIRDGFGRSVRLLVVASLPITAGVVAVGPALLPALYGAEYELAGDLAALMILCFPIAVVSKVSAALLQGLGFITRMLPVDVLATVTNLSLALWLIPPHGATGAAVANTLAQTVEGIAMTGLALFTVGSIRWDVPVLVRAAVAAVGAGVAGWAVTTWVPGITGVVAGVAAGGLSYLVLGRGLRVVAHDDSLWLEERVGHRAGGLVGMLCRLLSGRRLRARAADSGLAGPIRLVAYSDATEVGGAELSLRNLAGALDEEVDVTVMGSDPEVVNQIARYRSHSRQVVVPPVRGKWDLRRILRQIREVRALAPDVLHANLQTSWSGQYGIIAGLLCPGTCVVAVEHSPIPSTSLTQRWLRRVLVRRLSEHIAASEASGRAVEEAIGLTPGTVSVIHNGAHLDDDEAAVRPWSGPIAGSLGRLVPSKQYDDLIRAAVGIEGLGLLLVGDGPQREQLEQLAEQLGISERLRITGWTSRPHEHLAAMDVFVLPSSVEALPLAVLEAMHAGLPVITTTVGGLREAIEHRRTGLLIEPHDVDGLRDALIELLEDPELRRTIATNGQRVARSRFDTRSMAAAYEAVYRRTLTRG
jgi:glycosyltransferase involved in cell wall biosynthesis/O-antigen/teichoic acid export membrane protein